MKVACVLIPHFPFKAELLRRPDLGRRHTLIINTEGSRRTVYDFSPGLSGIKVGMTLQQATSLVNSPHLIEADGTYYQDTFNNILDTLEQISPDIEEAELGCTYVGLDGLEQLYGGDIQLARALQTAAPETWAAHIELGHNKFVSYVASLSATSGRPVQVLDDGSSFLRPFSVDLLPVSYKIKSRLHEFALHTLGDVADLSLGSLQAQFGPEGRLIWELAKGIDHRPLLPRQAKEEITESLELPEPTVIMETILIGAEVLLERALMRPELKGRRARLLILSGQVYRGTSWVRRLSLKEPTADKSKMLSRIKADLDGLELAGPIDELALTLTELTGETGRQRSMFTDVRDRERLQEAIKQLNALLGEPAPIFRVREVEPWSRIPERRHALVQYVP